MSEPGRYAPATAALSAITMPVTIIAAGDGIERACATATLMYVSLLPTQVAVALNFGSRTCRLVRATGEFSASILSTAQLELASLAGRSGRGRDQFDGGWIPPLAPAPGFTAPGVDGSIAVLWCRVAQEVVTGDHLLVVGTVEQRLGLDEAGVPLVRVGRRYMAVGAPLSEPAPEGYPI
ncbi:MAG: flavin reductase family protein [Candidatus Limnocylindrales bacterium]